MPRPQAPSWVPEELKPWWDKFSDAAHQRAVEKGLTTFTEHATEQQKEGVIDSLKHFKEKEPNLNPPPSWLPNELHDEWKGLQFTPEDAQKWGEFADEEGRKSIIKVMERQKKVKGWPSLSDVKAQVPVPSELVKEVFELDGQKHGYGAEWQHHILRNPYSEIAAEDLKGIVHNPNLKSTVRAEAWLHPRADPNEPLPKELVSTHFVGVGIGPKMAKLPDERLVQIIQNSALDDATKTKGHSYDTKNMVNNLINHPYNLRSYSVGEKSDPKPLSWETHPKTMAAILRHPSKEIASHALDNAGKLSPEDFQYALNTLKPTINGHPINDTIMRYLNTNLNNATNYTPEEEVRIDQIQRDFYNQNDGKDIMLKRLSANPHLDTEQVNQLVDMADHATKTGQGVYDSRTLERLVGHPKISQDKQFEVLQDPHLFQDKMERDYDINRGQHGDEQMMHPKVFNDLFPIHMTNRLKMLESNPDAIGGREGFIRAMLEHKHASAENLKWAQDIQGKQLEQYGTSDITTPELISHRNATPEIRRTAWERTKNPTQKEIERLRPQNKPESPEALDSQLKRYLKDRNTRFATTLLHDYGVNLEPDLVSDMVRHADITDASLPQLKPEHHRIMADKAKNSHFAQGMDANDVKFNNENVLKSVAKWTTDPDLIRDIHNHLRTTDWIPNEAPQAYQEGTRRERNELDDLYEPFRTNHHTPGDVISKVHEDFPNANLFYHPNFPEERIEHYANMPEGTLPNINDEWNRNEARKALKDHNPDQYSYKIGGPGDNIHNPPENATVSRNLKGVDFGNVEVKHGVAKLRTFRDKILEADPAKGELSPKMLGQGPFGGNWKPVQEKNGNISAKKIQEFIDAQPSQKFNFSHELWEGAQRHSDHPQRVFKLNVTTDQIKEMKKQGVYPAFKKLSSYSTDSGHPSDAGHTIGWVRYEHHQDPETAAKEDAEHQVNVDAYAEDESGQTPEPKEQKFHDTVHDKPEHIHVDEIQSDMGPNLIAKLRENPERARQMGVDPDHIEKVHGILFGKHHPSEVLMEAFRQHHRNQGRANIPIHILDAKTKAPISGQRVDKENPLPAHMQFTYSQMPKKMGFQPNKYGASAQQDQEGMSTPGSIWTDKIRKFEEELITKAIGDIKLGPETHTFPRAKQEKLPADVGHGRRGLYDYNHLLSPQQKRGGFQLYVQHWPDSAMRAKLYHRGSYAGEVEAIINPYNSEKLRINSAHVFEKHRGQGLGTALYEALLGHARHSGFSSVYGGSHSSMAHGVHNKLAEKHGLAYRAIPNYMEESYQHWPDQESWENAPTGPYDEKYGRYEYMIKAESPFKAAGFKHRQTGQVIETGTLHDVGALPGEYDPAEWIDGFIDHQGVFHDREQAKKLSQVAMKKHHAEWQEMYKNEDGIIAMLEQDDPQERILALKAATVMPHHILIAINDEHPEVRAFAATHPMINGPLLMECLRQCKSPDAFELLLGHESCDDTHMNYALETDWGGNGGPEDDELGKSETRVFYHVTPTKNVDSILAQGLIPQIGPRSQKLKEEPVTHLFHTQDHAEDAVSNWLGDEFDEDEPLSLLQVSLPSHHPVENDGFAFTTKKPVHQSSIKVVSSNL